MVRQSDQKHELKKRKKRSWLSSLGHGRNMHTSHCRNENDEMVRQSDRKHEHKKRKKRPWLSSLGHGRSVQLLVSSSVAKTAADGHIISILKTRQQEAGAVQ